MTPKPLRLTPNILVWDLPVRVFHWLLALSFAGAWITAESERWRLLHVTLGYTMGGLLAFRVLWGLVGTRHARFSDFVRGPRAALRYLGGLLRGQPEPYVGHNPAGALAIVALLALGGLIVATGWANYNELGGDLMEELHEGLASTMLAVVAVHVLAVIVSSRLHHENLVRAMITGRKHGAPGDGIRHAWRSVAALMLVAVLGFWTWQWQDAPRADAVAGVHATQPGDDDDD
ncbi:MAG: cytochrome b/b6 domain-containing protein [Aquabacterium sp.]|nr:cytochrome b/b6 domain-containing protein [Aquabacterium sp.]